ncbi:hypothetical protein LJC64_03170 [Ruminococcaceae bacterium OttesenSCG-928-A11]|nr:hypothetical protein [Ruminococcaceae bacterium OttesenSCG-928-A11]
MASWGPGLYQDDIAQDIRDTYKDQLHRGKTTEEITQDFISTYGSQLEDQDDGPIFWFALADTQWSLGRLLPFVKEKAIEWIDSGVNQRRWEQEAPAAHARKRAQVLAVLREKLLSPMPPEKKISQYKLYRCKWKTGDVFAYQFQSDYAKEKGVWGKYIHFVKIDEGTWWPGHIIPVVYVYNVISSRILNTDELKNYPYMGQTATPELFAEHAGDPEWKVTYRLELVNSSARIIPQKQLTLIGNIGQVAFMNDQRTDLGGKLHNSTASWKHFEKGEIDAALRWKAEIC